MAVTLRYSALSFLTVLTFSDPVAFADGNANVIGGSNVPQGKWTDVAGVFINGEVSCTGTLIAPDVVVTAGHCNDRTLTKVIIGSNDTSITGLGETIDVAQRFEYPSSQSTFDVTVLKLARPATTPPRNIATGWASLAIRNGEPAIFVGFGSIDAAATEYVPQLQEATSMITDAACEASSGCNKDAKPGGELGAGGMGIDTCPGDSGGPLFVALGQSYFLAGVTSRSYDDAASPCKDGGIYARPDKIVDWIERQVGVAVGRGPEPTAAPVEIASDKAGETGIIANDPVSADHVFGVIKEPTLATYKLATDGRIKFCASSDAAGNDELIVRISDKNNSARSLPVSVKLTILPGASANDCSLSFDEDSGCGCQSDNGNGSIVTMLVFVALFNRNRRRPLQKVSRSCPM